MIHFGKAPNEDKVVIEVSEEDLASLYKALGSLQLPERRCFHGVRDLIGQDPDLRRYIRHDGV